MSKVFQQNRLHNARNPNQGEAKKVLCVCSAGLLRSPTAAFVLSQEPFNFNTRAVGVHIEWALIPMDEVLLHWADELVFVHPSVFEHAQTRFSLDGKKCIVLEVPDRFERMDPYLVDEIRRQYTEATSGRSVQDPGN